MKVLLSARATSAGLVRAKKEFGRFWGFKASMLPLLINNLMSSSYSYKQKGSFRLRRLGRKVDPSLSVLKCTL